VLEVLHVEVAGGTVEFEDEASGGEVDVQLFGGFDEGFTLLYDQIYEFLSLLNYRRFTLMEILEYFLFELASRSLNLILLIITSIKYQSYLYQDIHQGTQ
jgi:hypothetical protein